MVLQISDSVRKGASLSAALEEHPRLFSKLYVSMVRVGEEAGVLPKVMTDLADLLEHEDEVRSEVVAAVAYPVFVLGFGMFTVMMLLTVVLPRLFSMLQEMLPDSSLADADSPESQRHSAPALAWILLAVVGGAVGGLRWYVRSPQGAEAWDQIQVAPAGDGLGLSRRGLEPVCPNAGHAGAEAAFRCCPR